MLLNMSSKDPFLTNIAPCFELIIVKNIYKFDGFNAVVSCNTSSLVKIRSVVHCEQMM